MRKICPTRRSVSGMYAFRGQSSIAFESTLERDFLIRTEFCLGVLDVIPQPVEIPFVATNGRNYTYTPDFLVYYRLGNCAYGASPNLIGARLPGGSGTNRGICRRFFLRYPEKK